VQASTLVFDFEEDRFDLGDVVLAAIAWGEWQMLERSLAEGLACEAEAQRSGEDVDPEELRARVVEFRRARRLLAGQDYLGWLSDRSLNPEDVLTYVRREALRRRTPSGPKAMAADELPADRLRAAVEGHAILSGQLRSWSERLAQCAAARRALASTAGSEVVGGPDELGRLLAASDGVCTSGLNRSDVAARAPRIAGLIASESAFRAVLATSESIERRLAEHRMDWQRLVWREATFHSEGAAREAALMVREDGIELESVATLAHGDSREREAYLSDVPELANLLSAAVPGELVGPFESDGSWRLALIRERTAVSADDPVLRRRTTDEIVEEGLLRHLAGRVSWHVQI
jgi:hypothetical protein